MEAAMSAHQGNTLTLRDGSVIEFRHTTNDRMPPEMFFAEQLRQSIRAVGMTQYALAKMSGVPQGAISVFLSGADVRLQTYSRLAHCMGFEIRQNPDKAPLKRQAGEKRTEK